MPTSAPKDLSKYGSKELKGTSVIIRRDGSKEYYSDGKLVEETSPKGESIIRVNSYRDSSGKLIMTSPQTSEEVAKYKQASEYEAKVREYNKAVDLYNQSIIDAKAPLGLMPKIDPNTQKKINMSRDQYKPSGSGSDSKMIKNQVNAMDLLNAYSFKQSDKPIQPTTFTEERSVLNPARYFAGPTKERKTSEGYVDMTADVWNALHPSFWQGSTPKTPLSPESVAQFKKNRDLVLSGKNKIDFFPSEVDAFLQGSQDKRLKWTGKFFTATENVINTDRWEIPFVPLYTRSIRYLTGTAEESGRLRTSGFELTARQQQQIRTIESAQKNLEKINTPEDFDAYVNNLSRAGINVTEAGGKVTFSSKDLETSQGKMYYGLIKDTLDASGNETKETKRLRRNYIATKGAEAVVEGLILAQLGVVGVVGRGVNYISNTGKVAKVGVAVLGTGLVLADVGSKSYEGYSAYKELGMSGKTGAIEGAILGSTQIAGFFAGATKGQISPIKFHKGIGVSDKAGKFETYAEVYAENPFGRGSQAYPLVTRVKGSKISFGYPKNVGFGKISDLKASGFEPMSRIEGAFVKHYASQGSGRLATEQVTLDTSYRLMKKLYGTKIEGVREIPFEKSKAFKNLNADQQKQFMKFVEGLSSEQKGFRGFWNAVRNKGLDRIYGSSTISAEGGFKKNVVRKNGEFGDFDFNFRDLGRPRAEQLTKMLKADLYKNVRLAKGTSLVEVKAPKGEWMHLADIHGTDSPELMLQGDIWGFGSKNPKNFIVSGNKMIKGSQLSQSFIEKGGSLLELRQNAKGQYFFSPPSHRMKDVSDFVSVAQRLNEVKGSSAVAKDIASLKNVLRVNFPGIEFDSNVLLYGGFGSKTPSPASLKASIDLLDGVSKPIKRGYSGKRSKNMGSLQNEIARDLKASASLVRSPPISPSLLYPSMSPSPRSRSPSSSRSPSMSPSASRSPSPSPSPSPWSPSPSPSRSRSPSRSPSMSPSPSRSPSPSMSPSLKYMTYFNIPKLDLPGGFGLPKYKRSSGRYKKGLAYIPDFTAKALGITFKPQSQAQLKKLLRKEYSGLEIARAGVLI